MNILKILCVAILSFGCASKDALTSSITQGLCVSIGDGGNGCCPGSPILIDLAGDGIHLTGPDDGVLFMLRHDQPGQWAWTQPGSDDAFLALDVDNSGRIDDGSELFGDGSTQALSDDPNGFAALAYYDLPAQGGNGDGVIDSHDAVWLRLRLWQDKDHDAYSAPYELIGLDDAGVHSFSLAYMSSAYRDVYGNEFRYRSTVIADAPVSSVVSDVWLQQGTIPESGPSDISTVTEWTCWSWGYFLQEELDGHGGGPCEIPAVQRDPYGAVGFRIARLVARSSTSRVSRSAAIEDSWHLVRRTARPEDAMPFQICLRSAFYPVPDPYLPLPYDNVPEVGDEDDLSVATKCYSHTVTTGGGGC